MSNLGDFLPDLAYFDFGGALVCEQGFPALRGPLLHQIGFLSSLRLCGARHDIRSNSSGGTPQEPPNLMAARSPRWMIFITVGLVHSRRVQTASMLRYRMVFGDTGVGSKIEVDYPLSTQKRVASTTIKWAYFIDANCCHQTRSVHRHPVLPHGLRAVEPGRSTSQPARGSSTPVRALAMPRLHFQRFAEESARHHAPDFEMAFSPSQRG